MQKSIGISVVVGIIIITAVMIYQFNETTWNITSTDEYYEKGGKVAHVVYPDNPQFLGPLQINKDKYLLGENIFVIIKNLQPEDKGVVFFFIPEGKLFYDIPFDGSKNEFKKLYFKPQLLKAKNICDVDQLVGTWTVVFQGYEQFILEFEVVDEFLPNNEQYFEECSEPKEMTDEMLKELEQIIENQNEP
jgi:hypothetical protein